MGAQGWRESFVTANTLLFSVFGVLKVLVLEK